MPNLLDAADFRGKSKSVTTWIGPRPWPECRRCGSSLAGRLEAMRRKSDAVVDVYRCPCGKARHVRREVAAA